MLCDHEARPDANLKLSTLRIGTAGNEEMRVLARRDCARDITRMEDGAKLGAARSDDAHVPLSLLICFRLLILLLL